MDGPSTEAKEPTVATPTMPEVGEYQGIMKDQQGQVGTRTEHSGSWNTKTLLALCTPGLEGGPVGTQGDLELLGTSQHHEKATPHHQLRQP